MGFTSERRIINGSPVDAFKTFLFGKMPTPADAVKSKLEN